jgi:hypothetical protein
MDSSALLNSSLLYPYEPSQAEHCFFTTQLEELVTRPCSMMPCSGSFFQHLYLLCYPITHNSISAF